MDFMGLAHLLVSIWGSFVHWCCVCLDKVNNQSTYEGDHLLFYTSYLSRKKKYAFLAVYHTQNEDQLSSMEDFRVMFQHSTYKELAS